MRRTRWISSMVTPFKDTEVSRTKRAPLNFIGSLANLLFGVVTEEQLHSYQNAVNLALSSTNRTIHVVNSLITVTKHIQLNIQENQHRISNLASFISNFTGAVSKQFSLLHNAIDQLSFQVNVEHLIVSLEQAVYYFSRQMMLSMHKGGHWSTNNSRMTSYLSKNSVPGVLHIITNTKILQSTLDTNMT